MHLNNVNKQYLEFWNLFINKQSHELAVNNYYPTDRSEFRVDRRRKAPRKNNRFVAHARGNADYLLGAGRQEAVRVCRAARSAGHHKLR